MVGFLRTTERVISGFFPMVFLLLAGLYFTFKTRGFQFKRLCEALKLPFSKKRKSLNGISSFGAVCNSLAATVGTGNIAGVAAAISLGGAGAVFWMWASATLSMVIKAAEIVLAVHYRTKKNKEYVGGAMYYIRNGMGVKYLPLAGTFCVAGIFSAFTTGNITQVNACVATFWDSKIIRLAVGAFFVIAVAGVIIGGVKKVTNFTTVVLPVMAVLYVVLCLGVIVKNINVLDDAFMSIVKGAFSPSAVTGGAVGSVYTTIITGTQKGVFSNEAGLGTAGMAHASAADANCDTQGLFGIFEVFVDTILICTLTALTILCSGVMIEYGNVASSELVGKALGTVYKGLSVPILSVMLCLFGFSSVLGWAVYGMSCTEWLFGKKGVKVFVVLYSATCFAGSVVNAAVAWRAAEFFNAVMLIVNLFSVLTLSKLAINILKGEAHD